MPTPRKPSSSSARPSRGARGSADAVDALPPITDAARGERLQRVLADAGVAARRACEELIEEGRVTVNGDLVDKLPAWVNAELDRIEVDGRPIPRRERRLYIMLNKPTRTLTTAADEPGSDRRTVLDLVDHPSKARLFPVGRLDYDTVGLILLTNDGAFANKLTHPRFGVAKTYRAVVKGSIADEDVGHLEEGIYLAERKEGRTVGATRTARVRIQVVRRDRERTVLELQLHEGRNRQVRRMLASVGCPVKKLERVAMGPVKLKGLPRGAWRELDRHELRALRAAVTQGKTAPDDAATPANPRKSPSPGKGKKTTPKKAPAKRSAPAKPGARPSSRPVSRPNKTESPVPRKAPRTPPTQSRTPRSGDRPARPRRGTDR